MSNHQLAEQYVRDQIRIMREHGEAPKLDAERRREFVAAVERTFSALRGDAAEPTRSAGHRVVYRHAVAR